MEIFVLRHGEAEVNLFNDTERRLTNRGRTQLQDTINGCLNSLQGIETVYVSPYRRAQESFGVISPILNPANSEIVDWLVPSASPRHALTQLYDGCGNQWSQRVLLVTHLPFCADFVAMLCGIHPGAVQMPPATLAAVSTEVVAADCGQLKWLQSPPP